MPNPVAHFEIYGDDPVRLGEFYHPTEPGGINGGLLKRPNPESRAWLNYVSVQSVDKTVEQAQSLGASVHRPKSAVPNQGWFAILADPDQNVFGVWQDDPNAA